MSKISLHNVDIIMSYRGNTSERELLLTEMRRDMSAAILRRVNAALHVTAPSGG